MITLAYFDTETEEISEEFSVSEEKFWGFWVNELNEPEKYPLGPDHSIKWGKVVFIRREG